MEHKDLKLPRGAYSHIARHMRPQVSPQAVRAVHLGIKKSARIEAAIARYVERLAQEAA